MMTIVGYWLSVSLITTFILFPWIVGFCLTTTSLVEWACSKAKGRVRASGQDYKYSGAVVSRIDAIDTRVTNALTGWITGVPDGMAVFSVLFTVLGIVFSVIVVLLSTIPTHRGLEAYTYVELCLMSIKAFAMATAPIVGTLSPFIISVMLFVVIGPRVVTALAKMGVVVDKLTKEEGKS